MALALDTVLTLQEFLDSPEAADRPACEYLPERRLVRKVSPSLDHCIVQTYLAYRLLGYVEAAGIQAEVLSEGRVILPTSSPCGISRCTAAAWRRARTATCRSTPRAARAGDRAPLTGPDPPGPPRAVRALAGRRHIPGAARPPDDARNRRRGRRGAADFPRPAGASTARRPGTGRIAPHCRGRVRPPAVARLFTHQPRATPGSLRNPATRSARAPSPACSSNGSRSSEGQGRMLAARRTEGQPAGVRRRQA